MYFIGPVGVLPHLKVVGNLPTIDPCFWNVSIPLGPHVMAQLDSIDPLILLKKSGCLCAIYFQKVIESKFSVTFYQNLSFV